MIAIISPSKLMDFKRKPTIEHSSQPEYIEKATLIMHELKKLSPDSVSKLMHINTKLSTENFERFQRWTSTHSHENAKQAIFAYKGEVYNGLNACTLSESELTYANDHLRILSALYGILKPLDRIQPYRLDMNTNIKVQKHSNLYSFWESIVAENLHHLARVENLKAIVNLASNEFSRMAFSKEYPGRVIDIQFKQRKNGELKQIIIYTKKARGMMVRFMIENRIEKPEYLQAFDMDGYIFEKSLSTKDSLTFVKDIF